MKLPASSVSISIAIRDHDLVVNMIPSPNTGYLPKCELVDVADIPSDVSSYMDQIERKCRERQ